MPRKPAPKPIKKHQVEQDARDEVQAHRQLGQRNDLKVASNLKAVTLEVLGRVRFGKPLSATQAPRPAADGKMLAPNGDPLVRVKLADGPDSGSSQYVLISPKTNQFYKEDNVGGLAHTTNFFGPISLPRGAQFSEKKHSADDLEQFERAARHSSGNKPLYSKPALLAELAKLMKRGDVAFDGQAMPKADVLSETVIKKDHPYTYLALVSKEDPRRITIKKVMTGGFVPAGPDDGSYSQPFTLK
jgi:hypothetical protein